MKNILLLVHDDEGQEARLQAALDLVRTLDGHLVCLDVTPFPVMAGDFYVASARRRSSSTNVRRKPQIGRS